MRTVRRPSTYCLAALLLAWIGLPAALAGSVSSRLGVQLDSFGFETYLGDADVRQVHIPLDLFGRAGETDWWLGLDFGSSEAEDWTAKGDLTGPAGLRAGASRDFGDGRFRVAGSGLLSLTTGPFSDEERLVLGYVSDHQLGLPLPLVGQGDQIRIDGSAIVWSSRRSVVFLGAFAEVRSAFDFRDDGLELDPADLVGTGLGIERGWNVLTARLHLFVEHPTDGRIDGTDAYSLGDRVRFRTEFDAGVGRGRGRASAEFLGVGSGELLPGWVLDSSWIRGGNRIGWSFAWETEAPSYWGAGVAGTHYRGFTGALGRADWFTPHFVFGKRSRDGELRLEVAYRKGSVRESRPLDGLGLEMSWTRKWIR